MFAGENRRLLRPLVDPLTPGCAPTIVPRFHTRLSLAKDLDNLGIRAGDMVMVHAAWS
ncbi:hypothetical protein ACVMIX_003200 [Rhizobium leguminosarum]